MLTVVTPEECDYWRETSIFTLCSLELFVLLFLLKKTLMC